MSEETEDELARRTHEHLNTNIRNMDRKASILLTSQFAFLGVFGTAVGAAWSSVDPSIRFVSVFAGLFGFLGVGHSISTIFPRESDGNLLYWETILQYERDDYIGEIEERSEREIRKELHAVNYSLSEIAQRKQNAIRCALVTTAAMVGLTVIGASVYFFGNP